ncbi:MAG: cell division protein FtsL [Betaproteobacteria bacterium]|nr:cell division protein FtsL [Betaproteobacteria bacterium]
MFKLNIFLTFVLVVCALGVVTSQHKSRKFFMMLENEREIAQQVEVEWGRLQLEQSTLVMHGRIEQIAREQLNMKVPDATKVQIISTQKHVDLPEMDGVLEP